MPEFEINNYKLTLEPHHIDLYKAYVKEELKNKTLMVTIVGEKEPVEVYMDNIFMNDEDMEFYAKLRPVLPIQAMKVKLSDITNSVLQL